MPFLWCAAPFAWLFLALNLSSIGFGLVLDMGDDQFGWSLTINFLFLLATFGPTAQAEAENILGDL